jgi:hypothetical protein
LGLWSLERVENYANSKPIWEDILGPGELKDPARGKKKLENWYATDFERWESAYETDASGKGFLKQ